MGAATRESHAQAGRIALDQIRPWGCRGRDTGCRGQVVCDGEGDYAKLARVQLDCLSIQDSSRCIRECGTRHNASREPARGGEDSVRGDTEGSAANTHYTTATSMASRPAKRGGTCLVYKLFPIWVWSRLQRSVDYVGSRRANQRRVWQHHRVRARIRRAFGATARRMV